MKSIQWYVVSFREIRWFNTLISAKRYCEDIEAESKNPQWLIVRRDWTKETMQDADRIVDSLNFTSPCYWRNGIQYLLKK